MKNFNSLIAAVFATGMLAATTSNSQPAPKQANDPLFDTISALDTAVFAAFNACSAPEQLQKHASYFSPNVEFYHDTGA